MNPFLQKAVPEPATCCPDARNEDARARASCRERQSHRLAVSEGLKLALFGLGCFWGAERKFWRGARRVQHCGQLRGRLTPNPV
jgi:hypothetical protein